MAEVRVLEYLDGQGRSPFAVWFDGLNATAAGRSPPHFISLGQGTGHRSKAWVEGFSSGRSMLVQAIESILEKTVNAW